MTVSTINNKNGSSSNKATFSKGLNKDKDASNTLSNIKSTEELIDLCNEDPKKYLLEYIIPLLKKGEIFSYLTKDLKHGKITELCILIEELGYSIQELKKIVSKSSFNMNLILGRAYRAKERWTVSKVLEEYSLDLKDLVYRGNNSPLQKWLSEGIQEIKNQRKADKNKETTMKVYDTNGNPLKVAYTPINHNESIEGKTKTNTKRIVVEKVIKEYYVVEVCDNDLLIENKRMDYLTTDLLGKAIKEDESIEFSIRILDK